MSTKQARMSVGCRDWMETVAALGAEAAAVYLYLRMLMRSIQTGEISLTLSEIAQGVKLPQDRTAAALAVICAGYMTRSDGPDGLITLSCPAEIRALSEAARKRAERALKNSKRALGQSEYIFFAQSGQSADSPTPPACEHTQNIYTSEVMMTYTPEQDGPSEHALFDNLRPAGKNKKTPRTPEKEKSLTEHTAPAPASTPELACDQLEANYIDVCGTMPPSLRETLRGQGDDVREAFYLYCRKKRDELGAKWTADAMRAAWLAARRIPEERRADSILAAYLGGWKTIRDSGSGVYFDKATGRVMSLVRGPVSPINPSGGTTSGAALGFLSKMRRD